MNIDKILDRFLNKIERIPFSGCWLWTGGIFPDGYGQFHFSMEDYASRRAHRASWRLYRGEIPKGLSVLHKCDVAICVNPDHLFLGTQRENIDDMVSKNRQARGERHGQTKLSAKHLEEIKEMRDRGVKAQVIAPMYGVTPERIWQLFPGK